ncbi:hypothetical protein ADU80_05030 [Clostridium botulinum]|uniref:hypothetical protein n=1 Tax=Clostridium botulinum TaxID=1491 RepID=UPI0002075AA9|nr:hypothetical protein [Clostridium botulinum]AEB77616.1 hypothetical protein CbC4_7005 [Clostridium botulinum BKT015925]KLU74181.1 hypothetical protein CBC3_p0321 [Clostridium botulinum V891]KOA86424.1 hypothetical protein ADU80_05030 [Clostridium botulinum]KOC34075.1 hypothetical protein ADU82_10870 [Clostridium botulinum]KOC42076.1 hypothetical protein ADU84_06735 [Clostridium botulinum]
MSSDFKSITVTFNRANKDVKEKINNLINKTGKTKVDIINEAIRQYQLNSITTNIDKDNIKQMVKESLLEILLQSQFNSGIQVTQNVQQPQMRMDVQEKSKKQLEKERLNNLNNKSIDTNLLDDED